jgi:hypothetical protein
VKVTFGGVILNSDASEPVITNAALLPHTDVSRNVNVHVRVVSHLISSLISVGLTTNVRGAVRFDA